MSTCPNFMAATSSATAETRAASIIVMVQAPPSPPTTLTRTFSEGELTSYSSVNSVREAVAFARRTRDSIRKSRASIHALRQDAKQTLQEAHSLRREMEMLLTDRRRARRRTAKTSTLSPPTQHYSDHEVDSDNTCNRSTAGSEVSELTFESSLNF